MRKLLKYAGLALAILLVVAAVFLIPTLWFKPWSIDHFYGRVFARYALRHPMLLSQLRILEPMGLDFHSDDLDDVSVEFRKDEARSTRRELRILRSYDFSALDPEKRLSAEILDWYLADAVEGEPFMFHDYPLNQLFGMQSMLPDFMLNTHQVSDLGSARDYVARISKFSAFFEQVMEGLRLREQRGIVPPRFVIERVLTEMRDFVAPEPTEHVLWTHLRTRLEVLDAITYEERSGLLERLENELRDSVYPAYRRLIEYFAELQERATTDDGVWKLPDGAAFYAHRLRSATTTDMNADQVHELGLEQVGRLRGEIESILSGEGYRVEDLGAALRVIQEEQRFQYPDTDEGRQQILVGYEAVLDEVVTRLEPLFDMRPRAPLSVERIPEFKQETAPVAYYQSPPMDGSKPGVFYVNLRDVHEHLSFRMRTLAYHEGIPGHHFQLALAQEMRGVAFFRRIIPFMAYTEGWALYAETLAGEQGFQPTPFDRLGYLLDQMLRAVRLVVDTGIHHKRWSREDAIEYMRVNTGMPESEIVAEVERYIVMPGQACAYMVGQMKILELRGRARSLLGDRFDIREFHNVVLRHGAVPLGILERLVDEWLAGQAAG